MYNSRKNLGKELSQDLKKSSVHFVGARSKESHLPLSLRMLLQGSHNQRLVHTLMAPSAVSLPRPLLVLCIQPPVGWPPVNAQRASRLLCTNLLVAISLKTDIPHFRQWCHPLLIFWSHLGHLFLEHISHQSLQILTVQYYPCFPCSPLLPLLLSLGSHRSWPALLNSASVTSVCFLASLSNFCLPLFPLLLQAIICQWSQQKDQFMSFSYLRPFNSFFGCFSIRLQLWT